MSSLQEIVRAHTTATVDKWTPEQVAEVVRISGVENPKREDFIKYLNPDETLEVDCGYTILGDV